MKIEEKFFIFQKNFRRVRRVHVETNKHSSHHKINKNLMKRGDV